MDVIIDSQYKHSIYPLAQPFLPSCQETAVTFIQFIDFTLKSFMNASHVSEKSN